MRALPYWIQDANIGFTAGAADKHVKQALATLQERKRVGIKSVCLSLGRRITDSALRHVQVLPNLEVLDATGCAVTGAGLAHVSRLTKLRILRLSRTRVTNAGMALLAGLTELIQLSVEYTGVSDAGLEHLHGLRKLTRLYYEGSRITETGFRGLQRVLPELSKPIIVGGYMRSGGPFTSPPRNPAWAASLNFRSDLGMR